MRADAVPCPFSEGLIWTQLEGCCHGPLYCAVEASSYVLSPERTLLSSPSHSPVTPSSARSRTRAHSQAQTHLSLALGGTQTEYRRTETDARRRTRARPAPTKRLFDAALFRVNQSWLDCRESWSSITLTETRHPAIPNLSLSLPLTHSHTLTHTLSHIAHTITFL